MKRLMRRMFSALLIAGVLFGISCGGGGGGGGDSAPLQPPTITNLAATRWNTVDTATGAGCGITAGVQDSWTLHIVSQNGNTLTFYDERSGLSGAVNGTMSALNITYSGTRYPTGGCTDMAASYNVNMNSAGTSFAGTGTITCNDAPACSVPVSIVGTKI